MEQILFTSPLDRPHRSTGLADIPDTTAAFETDGRPESSRAIEHATLDELDLARIADELLSIVRQLRNEVKVVQDIARTHGLLGVSNAVTVTARQLGERA